MDKSRDYVIELEDKIAELEAKNNVLIDHNERICMANRRLREFIENAEYATYHDALMAKKALQGE